MNQTEVLRSETLFSLKFLILLGAGMVWFALALFWVPFFWIGLLHNLLLVAVALVDRSLLQSVDSVVITRQLDDPVSLGAFNPVQITIASKGNTPLDVEIRDEPHEDFLIDERELKVKVPGGSERDVTYHLTPLKRGSYPLGNLNARFRTPLGFMILHRTYDMSVEARVYPNILETKKHQLLARKDQLNRMGLRVSRLRGTGLEFDSLREYVPDDELRKVDWKATARRNSMVTREYNFERSRNIVLMIDCGRLMTAYDGDLTKLDHAINAAMLLTYVSIQNDDRVGMISFSGEILDYVPCGKGKAQSDLMLDKLYGIQPEPIEPDYRRAMIYTANRIKKRSLIVLFTDLMDPDSSARLLDYINVLGRKHLVMCVALREREWDRLQLTSPESEEELYEQAVAISVLDDRARALKELEARGVLTVDATFKDLSIATVNRYLRVKQEARL